MKFCKDCKYMETVAAYYFKCKHPTLTNLVTGNNVGNDCEDERKNGGCGKEGNNFISKERTP